MAQQGKPWEQAGKTWESAMSQRNSHIYDQAAGLMEEFLKKYAGHEYASGTYIFLAACKSELKDPNGWEKALDQAIQKFPNSGPYFVAYWAKLANRKELKKNDEYIALLEAMLRTSKELPLDMTGAYANTPYGIWYQHNTYYRADVFPWLAEPLHSPGMEKDIVDMCDTPARAQKALRALAQTLHRHAKDLPPEWEFAHVMLLRRAGLAGDADKAIKAYADEWGSDPRGVGLCVLQGEYAQDANDDPAADAAYARLLKDYQQFASVSVYLGPRLDYLRRMGRLDDFAALAEVYLKTWPQGIFREKVYDGWLALLRPKVLQGGAEAYAKAVDILDQYLGRDSYAGLQWLIDVKLEMKKADEALPLAEKIAGPAYWSSQTFDLLKAYAAKDASLQKVVDQARQKYGIPVAEANNPADTLLKQLDARIKDDQVRFMEEIGDEMVQKYPQDAATLEAVKKLVDYYFAKLLPEPRDKWVKRMTDSYKLHPLTQAVMTAQATAMNASKRFDALAIALDALRERFPTAPYANWLEQRLGCFDAAKDAPGKAVFARKNYGAAADAGNVAAIVELAKHEVPLFGSDSKRIGDYWLGLAKKTAGTPGELYCLWRAVDGYCYMWTPPWMRDKDRKFLWEEGLDAMKEAQGRKRDPEFVWCLEYADVNILSEKHDGKSALVALKDRLTAKKYRDLTYRLNLEPLPLGLVEPNSLCKDGLILSEKMLQACRSQVDQDRIHGFQSRLYGTLGENDQAAKCLMKIVEDCPWPAKVVDAAKDAMGYMRDNPSAMISIADMIINKSGQLQDVILPVWYQIAYLSFNGHRDVFNTYGAKLSERFPASLARGNAVKMVLDEQASQKKP
jgi:hypothetical protein